MRQLRDGFMTVVTFSKIDSTTCTACVKGKQQRLSFKHWGSRAHEPLQVVHSDICGPMEEQSIGGSQYFFTLIDDYTRKVLVFLFKSKNNFTNIFKCTDNGGEYINSELSVTLKELGLQHQTTCPHKPEQNGLAE
ncbi:hypothetical protein PR048_020950 [Dryococelus australis]|uniref:Integrase catalytic domain-containing protein n=1 Tax=Dryococelus australis TaxID=614101 RepID=A0ABQ9GWV2_9NEOP|nr:hypothetical protein PR048_020950 [Dryococelus australis]